jgi:phage tail sheath protein FI
VATPTPTYLGVYITELQSSQHPITGVATSTAAFVGSAAQGPVNDPQTLNSWSDFVRIFGGLWPGSTMSYAVYQFFQNGGSTAVAVRVTTASASPATIDLGNGVKLDAADAGLWGANLQASVDYKTSNPADTTLWNLTVQNTATGATERYLNISTNTASAKSLPNVIQGSSLVIPDTTSKLDQRPPEAQKTQAAGGDDGGQISDAEIDPPSGTGGIYALITTDIFNILCIPPPAPGTDLASNTLDDAAKLCVQRRAMLMVDPPSAWTSVAGAVAGMATPLVSGPDAANAAMYFPSITAQDPLTGNPVTFSSCGAVAGVWASTDSQRGVWKAPAGTNAALPGGTTLPVPMTDAENGELNPLGLNCLRTFPVIGPVVWGARTLMGADAAESQWKYIPVRRTALYIEESLYRGTRWVVFEPNAEPLWASIRLNVGAFMARLYGQGAFAGSTPAQAYLVKCDIENNPLTQTQLGIVNILVGFAPLYPAEFVFISIEQLAGQG